MKIDNDVMRRDILVVAQKLDAGIEWESLKTFLTHRLETLISVVDDSVDTEMYDLFDDELLDYVMNIYLNGGRQIAIKIDNSKMYDTIFDTAIRLANGMGGKDIELFW